MQFQPYQKYKSSGIDWLGKIPEGWEVKRLKDVISSNEKSLSNNEDPFFEIKYIDISNVGTDKLNDKPEVFYFQDAPSRARRIPRKNDVILSTVRTYLKAVYFFENIEENTICSTGFSVLTPKRILPRFLKYSVIGENFIDNVIKFSKGVSYPAINDSELTALPLFLPNKQTQTAIADYLDKHTSLIDKKIELLKTKKQSYTQLKQTLINEVVTGKRQIVNGKLSIINGEDNDKLSMINDKLGDNAINNSPLTINNYYKDSGIEWIGKIPKHWEVKRLKDLINIFTGNSIAEKDLFLNKKNSYPYIATKDIDIETNQIDYNNGIYISKSDKNFKIAKKDSVLLCIEGANAGKKIAQTEMDICFVNKQCAMKSLNNKVVERYLFYFIQGGIFKSQFFLVLNGLIGGVSINLIKRIFLVIPPKSEQIAIAKYLDEKTSKIDQIIKKIDENILTLQEFRKTLINDVVTGKVKVNC